MAMERRWEKIALVLWLIVTFGIGIFTVHGYGLSVDEDNNQRYASETLEAYPSLFGIRYPPKYDSSYDGHGPAYLTLALISIQAVQRVFPNVSGMDLWHLAYLIAFLLTGLCLYWLLRRWFSVWTAWGILLLFTTQPVLLGHAFINPKDIPFLFLFTLSVTLGFRFVDSIYTEEAGSLEALYESMLHRRSQPASIHSMRENIRQFSQTINRSSLKIWFTEILRALRDPKVILAGIALGLATAVRPIAPFAGAIILLFLLIKVRSGAWIPAFAYFLIAGITTYVAWPHLWDSPVQRYIESLNTASSFPGRDTLLFFGNLYPSDHLPRLFFPTMLGVQLTEPALLLVLLGAGIAVHHLLKGKKLEPIFLIVMWFVVPTLGVILSRPTLYDNGRQLMFLWPALFMLTGMGLDALFDWIKLPLVKIILIALIAIPGIYASIHLYPYQYIYYNSLVGGVTGAYRNFELDYWDTSFREAMEYINNHAAPGTRVMVLGSSTQVARDFDENDLMVTGLKRVTKSDPDPYFLLASTRRNGDLEHCKKAQVVATVERDGAVLSYVKFIQPGQNCR